jgi:hypothetical protein
MDADLVLVGFKNRVYKSSQLLFWGDKDDARCNILWNSFVKKKDNENGCSKEKAVARAAVPILGNNSLLLLWCSEAELGKRKVVLLYSITRSV